MQLEPGVAFFVRALEHLGATTEWSCEGHPTGFYLTFTAPESIARVVSGCGFLAVAIGNSAQGWRLSIGVEPTTEDDRQRTLAWAAEAWTRGLGLSPAIYAPPTPTNALTTPAS